MKRKGDKLYVKWKGYDSCFNSWIDKKHIINDWIFPEPISLGGGAKVELEFSNYATKVDWNAAGVDTSKFAEKVDLVYLKSNVDKLDMINYKMFLLI